MFVNQTLVYQVRDAKREKGDGVGRKKGARDDVPEPLSVSFTAHCFAELIVIVQLKAAGFL